jgi:nitrogen fixation/metabolism regulation signal transduction histidine kinase
MSIRLRLVLMCLIVALLPAVPLSIMVINLLEKSFNVGLSESMHDALDSGMNVSRKHLELLHRGFEEATGKVINGFAGSNPDSAMVASALSDHAGAIDGFIMPETMGGQVGDHRITPLPEGLIDYSREPVFAELTAETAVFERAKSSESQPGITFYETEDRAVQFALWTAPDDSRSLLFYKRTDPEFIDQAGKLVLGRQLFAQLRLAQVQLNRSFFYPFVIVYAVILVLALGFAFLMSERLSNPIRRLVGATSAVAGGNWQVQLRRETGGEIGTLVDGFNRMVGRLDAQQRRLSDLEKMASWREMSRHLAHEIKNPLLPLRLTVQEMKDQYKGDDESYRELLAESVRVVWDELSHLQRLVKEFSSFAKMPGLKLTAGSIEELTRDVAKLYPQAETKIEAEPDLPELVFDPDQLRGVIINLYDNSLSVLPADKKAHIRIDIEREGADAIIEFTDNGPGIPPENLPKVFDPYFSTRKGGTGLGLAMVKSIILLHEGTIEARNIEDRGASFVIRLPIEGPKEKRSSTS